MPKTSSKVKFKCQHCSREFQRYTHLSEHSLSCTIGIRKKEEFSDVGILAHKLWSVSFEGTKRKKYDYNTFINHRDYKFFRSLSEFCLSVNSIDAVQYMKWCIKGKLKLKTWATEMTYEKFIRHYLVHEEPIDAIQRSISYIQNLKLNGFFITTVSPGTFLTALENGRISPWFYLLYWNSDIMLKRMNTEQVNKLNSIIDKRVWSILLRKNKDICEEIKKVLKKENI